MLRWKARELLPFAIFGVDGDQARVRQRRGDDGAPWASCKRRNQQGAKIGHRTHFLTLYDEDLARLTTAEVEAPVAAKGAGPEHHGLGRLQLHLVGADDDLPMIGDQGALGCPHVHLLEGPNLEARGGTRVGHFTKEQEET